MSGARVAQLVAVDVIAGVFWLFARGPSLSTVSSKESVQPDSATTSVVSQAPNLTEVQFSATAPQDSSASVSDSNDGVFPGYDQPVVSSVHPTTPSSASTLAAGDATRQGTDTESTEMERTNDEESELDLPPTWDPIAIIGDTGRGSVVFADPTGSFSEFARAPRDAQSKSDFKQIHELVFALLSSEPSNDTPMTSVGYVSK